MIIFGPPHQDPHHALPFPPPPHANCALMFVWFEWYIALAWLIRLGMIPVILRRQLAPGASLAWLGIIFLHPYIGLLLYAILGETRLGPHRVERHREIVAGF